MATEYARLRALIEIADNSSYYKPRFEREFQDLITVSEYQANLISAAIGGTTIDLTNYATNIDTIIIFNTDSTNYVEIAYDYSTNSNVEYVGPGQIAIINQVLSASHIILTADTAACDCWVVILD